MLELEEYFNHESDWGGHPELRVWERCREKPEIKDCRVELQRERDGLVFKSAKILMHFYGVDGRELRCDLTQSHADLNWDDDLNRELIKSGVKAVSIDNEKNRFALALRTALRKAENRYGDGYFNSVLISFIKGSAFAEESQVADILQDIQRPLHRADFMDSTECTEMITLAIRGRATELIECLQYRQPEAKEILSGAVARYLDERFSVTNRRILNWT